MSIHVQCEKCKSTHSLNRRLLGRSIRCPVCDATIKVAVDLPSADDQEELVESQLVTDDSDDDSDEIAEVELVESSSEAVSDRNSRSDNELHSDIEKSDSELSVMLAKQDDEEDEFFFPKRQLPKDDMDMTPMVDVTFLLLIFFMITSSFTSEKVIEEPPPLMDNASTNAKEEPEKILDTVRVQVDEFNAYTIILPGGEDRQASSKQDLLIALADARKELVTGANDDALKLAVEAHTESIHAAVVAAVDAGREKGFNSIQVTVVEEFD